MSWLDSLKQLPGIKQVSQITDFLGQALWDVSLGNNGFIKPLLNGTTGVNGLDSLVNRVTQNQLTGAQREGAELELQNQRELRRTQAADEVAGYQAAGINPALMYGQGMQTSTGNAATPSATPLSLSELVQLATVPAELGRIKAETEKVKADTAKTQSETDLNTQLKDFNDRINPLIEESKKVANDLGRSEIKKINSELDNIAEDTRKKAAETKEAEQRQMYYHNLSELERINAEQAVELLPYREALLSAQTQQAKAIAFLHTMQASYQRKLLSPAYIDALIDEMKASAVGADAKARVDKLSADIKTGKLLQVDSPFWQGVLDVSINYPIATLSNLLSPLEAIGKIAVGYKAASRLPASKGYNISPDPSDFPISTY